MKQYHDLLQKVLDEGILQNNRTGIPCYSIVGEMLSFDMNDGFPAITTKKLAFNQVKGELLGFIRGCTNVKDFQALGCNVWDLNAGADYWLKNPANKSGGDLGCIYGSMWRQYPKYEYDEDSSLHAQEHVFVESHIDQLANALHEVIHNPTSRRIKVEAWNPAKLDQMALPPCHTGFQLYVDTKNDELSMTMNQRSCDMFLGIPFNIASYALLLHLIAEATGYKPRHLKMFLTDVHIYENHVEQVKEQLNRTEFPLCKLNHKKWDSGYDINMIDWLEGLTPDDIWLENYQSQAAIKAPMAV
jgi:thymidylate synthase